MFGKFFNSGLYPKKTDFNLLINGNDNFYLGLRNLKSFDHLKNFTIRKNFIKDIQRKFSATAEVSDENLNQEYYEKQCQKSLTEKDFFNVNKLIKIEEMFDARVYMGHKEGTLNIYMKPYIFGSRLGHLIIDLDQTVVLLQEALNVAAHIAFRNGIILFINKSSQVQINFAG